MIEVVYNQEQVANAGTGPLPFKFPKNIRQVGNPAEKRKIYMEDYVVTYVHHLAEPSTTYARGAILLGNSYHVGDLDVIFISGAIEAQNLELDLDETVFTNETWTHIYEEIKKYFPELEVVGWFLSRLGFSTAVNDKIKKTHMDNFSGNNKTLYVIDALEKEDRFYLYQQGDLRPQEGYYIYYEKNEAMQNYMIEKNQDTYKVEENTNEVTQNDTQLLKNYREIMESRKAVGGEKQVTNLLYVASTLLTIAFLALGITIVNNYDKMKHMESSLNNMSEFFANHEIENTAASNTEETMKTQVQVEKSEITKVEATTEAMKKSTTKAQASTTERTSKTSTNAVSSYYTVKEGDTLVGISMQMYHSRAYVTQIMEANHLTKESVILPGQVMIIPKVELEYNYYWQD